MRRISEEDDASAAPAPQRQRHEQPPPHVVAHSAHHLDHGRMPASKSGERLLGARLHEPFFRMRPCRRTFDHRQEVNVIAAGPDGVVEQMR